MTRAVIALALAATAARAAEPGVLTLEDAVAQALANSRRVGIAEMGVERAENAVAAARTRRLPSLDLQARAGTTLNAIRVTFPEGAFGSFPSTGPIPATDTVVEAPRTVTGSVNATVAQPLTQLRRVNLGVVQSGLARDAERETLRETRQAVAADVRRLYYALVQMETAVAAADEEVALARELLRLVGEQVAQEAALAGDALEARAGLAAAEYARAALETDRATARQRLNHLMGRALDVPLAVTALPEATLDELELGPALSQAAARRPDLARARIAVAQAENDRRLKQAESIPELSVAVTYDTFLNVDLLPRNVAQVGLQLKWEPFDWGRKGKERAEKALSAEQARARAREAESALAIEVTERFRALQESRLLVEARRLAREAATERLRVARERHRQEAVLLKDLLAAQREAAAAAAEHDRALMQFWSARADLKQSIGEEL
jgi:outer membrane protein